MMGRATWRTQTPSTPGAIAAILITGDVDKALSLLGVGRVDVGRVGLREIAGIDTAVIARWTASHAHIMPHGGSAILRAFAERLTSVGLPPHRAEDPRDLYPEAADGIEARMLAALARAASPLAIDVLLDQPRRWHVWRSAGGGPLAPAALDRLMVPPLVVIVGPPNIGKSTLINALAGRDVSVVADEPGSTRDHVGVSLDLAGLVVRCVDAPGMASLAKRDESIESQAAALACEVSARADLLLVCGDAMNSPPSDLPGGPDRVTVALRRDLGSATWAHDLSVCAPEGDGLVELVGRIRERLVPADTLASPHPWPFWRPMAIDDPPEIAEISRG